MQVLYIMKGRDMHFSVKRLNFRWNYPIFLDILLTTFTFICVK